MMVLPPQLFRLSRPKDRASAYFASLRSKAYHDVRGAQPIRSLSWNAPGTRIAVALSNHTARVWNPEKADLKYTTELRGHAGPVNSISWDPNDADKLCSSSTDGSVRLWDYRVKTCTATIALGNGVDGKEVHYHPDGQKVAVNGGDHEIKIFDTRALAAHLQTFSPGNTVNQMMWSSNGKMLMMVTETGEVRLQDYPGMGLVESVAAHASDALCMALDPRGLHLACGGSDAVVGIWDTDDWICLRAVRNMEYPITSVSFTFDGIYLAIGSEKANQIKIVRSYLQRKAITDDKGKSHVDSGDIMHTISPNHPVTKISWHPNRYWLAYAGDSSALKIVGAAGPDK